MKWLLISLFLALPLYSRTFDQVRQTKTSTLSKMMVFHHLTDSIEKNNGLQFQLGTPSLALREGQSDRLQDDSDLMPNFVLQTIGTYSEVDGPNCWNTSLNFNDPSIGIHHTSMVEMIEALASEYEKIDLRNDNFLQMGDIISLWRPGVDRPKELLHSTVYLGNGITFDKHSWEKDTPYLFSTIKAAFDLYDLDTQRNDQQSVYRYTVHRLKPE